MRWRANAKYLLSVGEEGCIGVRGVFVWKLLVTVRSELMNGEEAVGEAVKAASAQAGWL